MRGDSGEEGVGDDDRDVSRDDDGDDASWIRVLKIWRDIAIDILIDC